MTEAIAHRQQAASQEQSKAPPAGLEAIAAAYQQTKQILQNNERLQEQVASAESIMASLSSETDLLKRRVRQLQGERDHYFRAFSALSSQLDSIGAGLLRAVQTAKTHSRDAASDMEPARRGDDPVPAFLTKGPSHQEEQVSLESLEAALQRSRQPRGAER